MKASIVHTNSNSRGGAVRVDIATIATLVDMGIDVDLIMALKPDLKILTHSFVDAFVSPLNRLKKFISLEAVVDMKQVKTIITITK